MNRLIFFILLFFSMMGVAVKSLPAFNFDKPILSTKPNHYLICPKGYCAGKQNQDSPVFDVSQDTLEETWLKIEKTLLRTRLVYHDVQSHQYLYVQRSAVFRFPDYVFIRFVGVNANKSSVMIYSHAHYGYYDFNVNKTRVREWLTLLKRAVAQKRVSGLS